jgi:hypothetical protein
MLLGIYNGLETIFNLWLTKGNFEMLHRKLDSTMKWFSLLKAEEFAIFSLPINWYLHMSEELAMVWVGCGLNLW